MTGTNAARRHLSVLIELDKDKGGALELAATRFFAREPAFLPQGYNGPFDPSEIELDREFGALPVGPGRSAPDFVLTRGLIADMLDPKQSKKFVVRGFVKKAGVLERWAGDHSDDKPIFHSDPPIGRSLAPPRPTCGTSHYVGTVDDVRGKIETEALADLGLDGSKVALAIVDTGIFLPRITRLLGDVSPSGFQPNIDAANSWTENVVTKPFGHRLGHGTMCAFDALIAAPNATLLDYPMLLARPGNDPRLPVTIAAAMRFYAQLLNFWLFRHEPGDKYSALVVSNSWGTFHPSEDAYPRGDENRYIDNPSHTFHWYIQLLAALGVDIIFSGNNCGSCCPSGTCLSQTSGMIMGANSYREVLTLGGCDINDDWVGYSSCGPSIAGMCPEKPDLLAYTHFLGSRTRQIFIPDTGVSAACAVAAGCVAALRTKVSPDTTPPHQLFSTLRSTARDARGAGWDPCYGYGIIYPVAAAEELLP